ncbi:MAG: FRG domain-containing protein [Janthinobacterium lividum]
MIKDVTKFINEIKRLGKEDDFENFFRGHSNSSYELTPTIYREGLIDSEDKIFREIILRIPQEFQGLNTTIEKLVKMQHYGVPTRLLDLTSNPLVALFFACSSNKEIDGEVLYLRISKNEIKFYDSDTVSVLSNIAKRPIPFNIENYSGITISDFNMLTNISFLHHDIKEEKPYFKEIINPNDVERVFAVKVKLDNPRILKQNGSFLIFGIDANKQRQATVPRDWIMNSKIPHLNLKIPAAKKQKILNELEILGINESTLFPELDYQAKYLINKFKKVNS